MTRPNGGGFNIHGRLSVTTVRPDGTVRERREGDNITCTNGLTAFAAALVWAGIQDQAANLGVTSPTFLTPLFGAIGTGNGTVAASDTALFSEYARQTVGAGGSTPATASLNAQTTWLFYFPSPTSTLTITEAGLFSGATSVLGSGVMLDHWAFSPVLTFLTTDTLILQASFAISGS
ncbi:hypothetical protein ACFC8N_42960 [Streptomyces sp. NPDC055966]|uniref:hypothetical protein n=1 Tax=Streptomyces sp. NPDC055966 TaxID=3345669 RepID=UPI0035DAA6F5